MVAEEVRTLGRRALVGVADVRDERAFARIADETRNGLGPPRFSSITLRCVARLPFWMSLGTSGVT